MPVAIITGAGGLIGSEAVDHFIAEGFDVVGIENDMRARFFGPESSTSHVTERLVDEHDSTSTGRTPTSATPTAIERIFAEHAGQIELVIHTAAQPSHDWAASEPQTDFGVNANGTLNLLEAARAHCPDAPFIFCSTNKVYGDTPNRLPLQSLEKRLELPEDHPYYKGIDTSMSIDASTHSLFGVSKAAADLLVQEYGYYFEMPTVCFRGGCLTGPQHAGAKLHGFLAYLMKCTVTGTPYTVFGYEGKQVRDNIHSADLIAAFDAFRKAPRAHAVYNIGGGRFSNCSMLEAIDVCERIAGRELELEMGEEPRIGDHRWWISDLAPVPGRLPRISAALRDRRDPAGDVRAEPRALDGDAGMKFSVVMPAQNEEGSVGATVEGVVAALERERDRLRGRRRQRRQRPTRPKRWSTRSAPRTRACAVHRSHYERGFGIGDPGRARRLRGRRRGDRDGRRLRRPATT